MNTGNGTSEPFKNPDMFLYAHELKEAGFTSKQAEIQAEKLFNLIENHLATKKDIESIRKDIQLQTYKITIRFITMLFSFAITSLGLIKYIVS